MRKTIRQQEALKPIVKLGLEVDYVPGTLLEVKKILSRYTFDYLIGSVPIVHDKVINDFTLFR
jgi:hypothetical protein